MTMTANATNALPCESIAYDHMDSPSTCNHKGALSPAASMISTAPNTPSAEAPYKADKMLIPMLPHQRSISLPAEIQTTDFDDSDDEDGLPGYPSWGSSWSMRSLRTPDSKPAQSPFMGLGSSPMASLPKSFHLDDTDDEIEQ